MVHRDARFDQARQRPADSLIAVPVPVDRRTLLRRAVVLGLAASGSAILPTPFGRGIGAMAQEVSCPPPVTLSTLATPAAPSGKKIGVTVAYLSVPFYAGFKRGLEDGAREFGFE